MRNHRIVKDTDENFIGRKVKPGPDWVWGDQNRDSDYGIIDSIDHISSNELDTWVYVYWYNQDEHHPFNYRVGKQHFDLYYYETEEEIIEEKAKEALNYLNKLEI